MSASDLQRFLESEIERQRKTIKNHKPIFLNRSDNQRYFDFTDASLQNKLAIPHNPNRGISPKIKNFIKAKLFVAVGQILEKLIFTQERFNHETISNFEKTHENIKEHSNENTKNLEAIKSDLKEQKNSLANISAKIDSLEAEVKKMSLLIKNSSLKEVQVKISDLEEVLQNDLEKLKKEISVHKKIIASHEQEINPDLDFNYPAFEDKFRGPQTEIKNRQTDYIGFFANCKNVYDVGCGRGELLELFEEHNIEATGIDMNPDMVEICQKKNLKVKQANGIDLLKSLNNESCDGIISLQVIEHLKPQQLLEFIKEAHRVLKPGSHMVVETINPMSLEIYRSSLVLDITHVKPYHPETVKFIFEQYGFSQANISCRSMSSENDQFTHKKDDEIFNSNMDKLNKYLTNYLDYAIIAKK